MCLSNIYVFMYKTVYTGICTAKWAKWTKCLNFLLHISVAHEFYFCGAPYRRAPQNYSAWGPAELFLWRTRLGAHMDPMRHRKKNGGDDSVAHRRILRVRHRKLTFLWCIEPVRHRKNCGDDSVAHRQILQVRHRKLNWCATDSLFYGSDWFKFIEYNKSKFCIKFVRAI